MDANDGHNDLMEKLAAVEHERWSHWQRYVHSQCLTVSDGSLIVPTELVSRWERLISTPYAQLTQDEQESDREQVRRYLPLVTSYFTEIDRNERLR
jgi:hypothetical protein